MDTWKRFLEKTKLASDKADEWLSWLDGKIEKSRKIADKLQQQLERQIQKRNLMQDSLQALTRAEETLNHLSHSLQDSDADLSEFQAKIQKRLEELSKHKKNLEKEINHFPDAILLEQWLKIRQHQVLQQDWLALKKEIRN